MVNFYFILSLFLFVLFFINLQYSFAQIAGKLGVQVELTSSVSNIDESEITLRLDRENEEPLFFEAPIDIPRQFDVLGAYDIEVVKFPTGLTVDSSGCSGTISQQGSAFCIIQFGTGLSVEEVESGGDFGASSDRRDGIGTTGIRGTTGIGSDIDLTGLSITATESSQIIDDPNLNPPFKSCLTQKVSPTAGAGDINRYPVSAEYIIEGRGSIEELKQQLQKNNNIITIEILTDLQSDGNDDNAIALGFSDPHYTGKFIVGEKYSKDFKEIGFFINDIDTKCKYITTIQPLKAQSNNKQITPLGNIGVSNTNEDKNKPNARDYDFFLYGQTTATPRVGTAINTGIINPPFAPCVVGEFSAPTSGVVPAGGSTVTINQGIPNVAKYIVKGYINEDKLEVTDEKQEFRIVLTTDLDPSPNDQAKTVNSNSQVFNVKLVANANDKDKNTVSDFTLRELSTECVSIDFDYFPLPGDDF